MSVSWFHKHDWEIIRETYAPAKSLGSFRCDHPEMIGLLQRLMFGVTTRYERCKTCRQTRIVEMLGARVHNGELGP